MKNANTSNKMTGRPVADMLAEYGVLFGDRGKKYPTGAKGMPYAEQEFIYGQLLYSELSTEGKLALRNQFRAADKDRKWKMFKKLCPPLPESAREVLGLL